MAPWVTFVLWLVAVPNIVTGLWAVADPRHWYDTFPGWAPHLVAAHPPFNEHLALDAGAGLLAVGVISASAALARSRPAHVVAAVGLLAFSVPHATYHVLHPSEILSAAEEAPGTISLLLSVAAGVAVLVGSNRATTEGAAR